MIIGGSVASSSSKKEHKTYFRMVQNVQLMGCVLKMAKIDNPMIGIMKENARGLHHPYNNALVVSICLGDYNTH